MKEKPTFNLDTRIEYTDNNELSQAQQEQRAHAHAHASAKPKNALPVKVRNRSTISDAHIRSFQDNSKNWMNSLRA